MNFTKKEEVHALFHQLVPGTKVQNFQFDGGVGMADVEVEKDHEMTAVYLPKHGLYNEWESNYLKGLREYYPSTTATESESDVWDMEYALDDENKAALAKMTIGSGVVLLVANSADSMVHPRVTDCIETSRQVSRKTDLSDIVAQNSKQFKQSIAGPIITGLILAIMAVIHIGIGEDAVYSLRSIEIPGFVSGPILGIMAIFAFRGKIKFTFLFMIISLVWSFLVIGMELRVAYDEEVAAVLMLCEVSFLVSAMIFHKNFGFKSVGDLFKQSFSK